MMPPWAGDAAAQVSFTDIGSFNMSITGLDALGAAGWFPRLSASGTGRCCCAARKREKYRRALCQHDGDANDDVAADAAYGRRRSLGDIYRRRRPLLIVSSARYSRGMMPQRQMPPIRHRRGDAALTPISPPAAAILMREEKITILAFYHAMCKARRPRNDCAAVMRQLKAGQCRRCLPGGMRRATARKCRAKNTI